MCSIESTVTLLRVVRVAETVRVRLGGRGRSGAKSGSRRRPVIHLATVVHGYLNLVGPAAEGLGASLMTSRPVIEYLIRNAEYCETLVAKSSRLRIDADRLIKI